jgi:hypothetical protein
MMGLAALCVVVGLVAWWRFVADNAIVAIPNPVMPNPNAFDFYTTAARSLVNTKQVDAASMTKSGVPVTLAQKEALLQQNAGALQSLHQGFAYEYRNPPIRSLLTPTPQFAAFRRVSRLLALQNQVRAAQNDWGAAAESALDAIRLGEDTPRGAGLMAQFVGIACESIGQRPMWNAVEHLNAAQSRTAIQRLETMMDRHFSYADTIREEKWTGQGTLEYVFRNVQARRILADANGFVGVDGTNSDRLRVALYLLYGKKRVLKNYTEFMDAVAEGVRKPYAVKQPPLTLPSDPINQLIYPVFDNARFSEVKAETQNRLLLVALALRAYRLEHGHYPASLAELTPGYLKQVPDDLFALHRPLSYRLDGKSYLLYSLGPDNTDDEGTPVDDPAYVHIANSKARYRVEKGSIGDIVAGVNTP